MFDPAHFNPLSLALLFFSKDSAFIIPLLIAYQVFSNWHTIDKYINRCKLRNKTQYEISDKLFVNKTSAYTYGQLSKQVNSILYYIRKQIDADIIKINKAINMPLIDADFIGAENLTVVPSSANPIRLTEDITAVVDISIDSTKVDDDSHPKHSANIDEIHIIITLSTTKSLDTVITFINKLVGEFTEYEQRQKYKDVYIVKPIYERDEIIMAHKIPFKSTKTFDNLFFDGKDELIRRLDSFKRRDNYKLLGMPESLGILLYGDPGTGKTSTIKAIANYMKMNIIIVPMSKIKTKEQLESLFYEKSLSSIPCDNRIYVFEEVDCNGWEDVVCDRRLVKETPSEHSSVNDEGVIELIVSKLQDTTTNRAPKKDEIDKLNLGSFLEIIDGIVEIPGRIVIMTTNRREVLDPALTRPGRIDIEIEFKKLRKPHIAAIYKKWFGHPINPITLSRVPDYRYTQADISQLLFKHESSPEDFCQEICKEE